MTCVFDIRFSPTDTKFVSAGDDNLIKVWNFNEGIEERVLTGHGWEVRSVDWHPTKGLIASGSKDNLVKLWDPRTSRCLSTSTFPQTDCRNGTISTSIGKFPCNCITRRNMSNPRSSSNERFQNFKRS